MKIRLAAQLILVGVAALLLGGGLALSHGAPVAVDELGSERGYTALVTVVVLTTLATPPLLKWTIHETRRPRVVTRPTA